MEEMIIWEQYTVTLNRDPRRGFGIAISGGRDRPSGVDGDTSIIISDVVPGGPADGRLQTRDKIAMVNGISMENVSSSFAIHTLKGCGKVANITVKRPRKVHLPAAKPSPPKSLPLSSPALRGSRNDDSDEEDGGYRAPSARGGLVVAGRRQARADHNRGYDGDSSSERSSGRNQDEDDAPRRHPVRSRRRSQDGGHRRRSQDSSSERQRFTNGYSHRGSASGLALVSGFKRLPQQDVPMKPVRSVLVKSKESEEFGLKLGSQIFIKHITDTGLAAKDSSLQEGDLILKINGVSSENLSLEETRRLIELSEGTLTLVVLRDNSQFLVNIPQLRDSESESSHLDDISDLGSDISPPPALPASVPNSPGSPKWNSSPTLRHSSREQTSPEKSMTPPLHEVQGSPENDYDAHADAFVSQTGTNYGYSPDSKVVRFIKAKNIGLRLAGGNDVGIFVAGVQEGSPAEMQGIQEGDQVLQVNEQVFHNLTREEAIQYLLELTPGEEVALHIQNKQDIYRKMVKSNVGDSFYIRTHFDFEKDTPSGLSFTRGEVFHVVDTMYRGKVGSWLAMRMGKDLQELDKGIIPNRNRAEQIASLESVLKATSGAASSSGPRAEFWKLRGLRGAKRNLRKSREDLSALTKQGHYPPYERVVLKEATFKRPVVILGPIADIAMQKLSTELTDQFEIAESVAREGSSSKVIKLDSVWNIAKQDKHALLDITPAAVERLNYVQYFPIVVFCEPDSRQGVKAMRQWLAPESKKSSRRLYAQAGKMRRDWSHLFTATISLAGGSNSWYQSLKDIIRVEQSRPVWMTEEQVDVSAEEGLDLLNQPSPTSPGYLTCDSRANSDYDETDAEGEAYTEQDLEESYQEAALARSSEPTEQDLSQRVATALAYPVQQHDGDQQPEGQWRENYGIREYEHNALRKKFTHAQTYDSESDHDYGYDWGPATDL